MFKERLLSGIVLVILLLIFLITGGEILLAALGLVSLIGLFELFRALKIQKSPVAITGYLATIIFYTSHLIPGFSDNFALNSIFMLPPDEKHEGEDKRRSRNEKFRMRNYLYISAISIQFRPSIPRSAFLIPNLRVDHLAFSYRGFNKRAASYVLFVACRDPVCLSAHSFSTVSS